MTDGEIWNESDRKYVEYESDEISLTDSFDVTCRECDGNLTWVLDPDPDHLRYNAECYDCEMSYSIEPTKVTIVQTDRNI